MQKSDIVIGLSPKAMCSVLQRRLSELEYINLKLKKQNKQLKTEKNSLELKLSDIEKRLGLQKVTEIMQEIEREAEKDKALLEARELIQEIVTNRSVISADNPSADYVTQVSLKRKLSHWFQRAEEFLSCSENPNE